MQGNDVALQGLRLSAMTCEVCDSSDRTYIKHMFIGPEEANVTFVLPPFDFSVVDKVARSAKRKIANTITFEDLNTMSLADYKLQPHFKQLQAICGQEFYTKAIIYSCTRCGNHDESSLIACKLWNMYMPQTKLIVLVGKQAVLQYAESSDVINEYQIRKNDRLSQIVLALPDDLSDVVTCRSVFELLMKKGKENG